MRPALGKRSSPSLDATRKLENLKNTLNRQNRPLTHPKHCMLLVLTKAFFLWIDQGAVAAAGIDHWLGGNF